MLLIFLRFLLLGLISFGGPAAHIGYFRQTFVTHLAWLDEAHFARIVALSQLLPGPGSSQVGFAIGYHRGGLIGALAAFLGFTLPSFILMYCLSVTRGDWLENEYVGSAISALKLLAVVVVADAVLAMLQQFCQQQVAKMIMLLSAISMLLWPSVLLQMTLLLVAAWVGVSYLGLPQGVHETANKADANASARLGADVKTALGDNVAVSADANMHSLVTTWNGYGVLVFILLFILSFIGQYFGGLLALASQFYQVGSLVFGGGHVVLPLLQVNVADAMNTEPFLTGYAFAQAVPGPMFTLASFLGAQLWVTQPLVGALVATVAIFLPGFLLMLAALSSWNALCERPGIAAAVAGVNAAVVGLLVAAFFQPILISAVHSTTDMALVLFGFGWLKVFKPNIVLVVFGMLALGMLLSAPMITIDLWQ